MNNVLLIQPRDFYGTISRTAELAYAQTMNKRYFGANIIFFSGQPSFNSVLGLCQPDTVNIIANGDIYFDHDSNLRAPEEGQCFALSRWDVAQDGSLTHHRSAWSQDAWVFNGLPPDIDAPFPMGVPGCDNALAALLTSAGMMVLNPSETIKAYHVHISGHRTYDRSPSSPDRVPPPYRAIPITA